MASRCPKCELPVPDGALQCGHCEAVLPSDILVGPTTRPGVAGRWEVLEALESLGTPQGVLKVYRVRNKTTEDEVGLRMLPLSLASDEPAADRLREILPRGRALQGAPGILAVLGFEVEDRTPYLLTELFSGTTLQDLLKKEQRLPADEVRRIGAAAADALAAAHGKNVFHADLRTSSVLLGPDGEVRITDFGVGRVIADAAVRAIGGGPGRAPWNRAPEFVKSDLPDARADLFSLGCVLYEALTGERRFPDAYRGALANPVPGGVFPDPFSGVGDVDPGMRAVILRLLAPAPADRFKDAVEAGAALRGGEFARANSATVPGAAAAAPPSTGEGRGAGKKEAGKKTEEEEPLDESAWEPKKTSPMAPVFFSLIVVAGLGFAGWAYLQVQDMRREAREQEEVAGAPEFVPAPAALPGLPPPAAPIPAGLDLPERVVVDSGRIRSQVDGAELVYVPAGDFVMGFAEGGKDESTLRRIKLPAFLLDRHEVTVGQYRRFCLGSGRTVPHQPAGSSDSHPVVNVSWIDAAAFARWAGRRLPTEAEWERGARGDSKGQYPWGAADEPDRRNGPGDGDGFPGLAPAGSFPAGSSSLGVLDSLGNAWEWCADWYDPDYYLTGPPEDPPGPASGTDRVVRGGSCLLGEGALRVSFRNHALPAARFEDIGFRCAADLKGRAGPGR